MWMRLPATNAYIPVLDDNRPAYSGMGFFVRASSRFFLTTASHVAKHMASSATAEAKGKSGQTVRLALAKGEVYDQSMNFFMDRLDWHFHADTDVAVVEIVPRTAEMRALIEQVSIDLTNLSATLSAPAHATPLTIYGMAFSHSPLNDVGMYEPFGLECKSASGLRQIHMDGKTNSAFLISEPIHRGFSGTPVLAGDGTAYRCYGVAEGTLRDPENSATFGVVVPSVFAVELIRQVLSSP
jgi:hypothetical protein